MAKPVRKKLICHLISEPTWALPSCELISCKVDGERDGGREGGRGKEKPDGRRASGRARAGSSHLTRGAGGSPSPVLCVAGRFCKRFLWSF